MSRLFKVTVKHYAPKDSITATLCWLIAADEEAVIAHLIATEITGWDYDDWNEEEGEIWVDDEYFEQNPGQRERAETLGLKVEADDYGADISGSNSALLRWKRGDFDEYFSDAHYGITNRFWDEGQPIDDADAAVLVRVGVAQDVREGR